MKWGFKRVGLIAVVFVCAFGFNAFAAEEDAGGGFVFNGDFQASVQTVQTLISNIGTAPPADETRKREKYTLPQQASPVAHAVLAAIARTSGSSDTINKGQRAAAIQAALAEVKHRDEVIDPESIAVRVKIKGNFSESELSAKINHEIARAIERKLIAGNGFKFKSKTADSNGQFIVKLTSFAKSNKAKAHKARLAANILKLIDDDGIGSNSKVAFVKGKSKDRKRGRSVGAAAAAAGRDNSNNNNNNNNNGNGNSNGNDNGNDKEKNK